MITRQADYAVRSVLDLALRPDEQAAVSREIAERQGKSDGAIRVMLSRTLTQLQEMHGAGG